jgi:signal transduction histidine kinase
LILNAAQAIGDRDGSILVDAEVVDDRLALRVTDDGPGFPEELLESGISSFVTWRKDGTGLGLATVQRFVKESGGLLRFENRRAGGASVTIDLPRGGLHG